MAFSLSKSRRSAWRVGAPVAEANVVVGNVDADIAGGFVTAGPMPAITLSRPQVTVPRELSDFQTQEVFAFSPPAGTPRIPTGVGAHADASNDLSVLEFHQNTLDRIDRLVSMSYRRSNNRVASLQFRHLLGPIR